MCSPNQNRSKARDGVAVPSTKIAHLKLWLHPTPFSPSLRMPACPLAGVSKCPRPKNTHGLSHGRLGRGAWMLGYGGWGSEWLVVGCLACLPRTKMFGAKQQSRNSGPELGHRTNICVCSRGRAQKHSERTGGQSCHAQADAGMALCPPGTSLAVYIQHGMKNQNSPGEQKANTETKIDGGEQMIPAPRGQRGTPHHPRKAQGSLRHAQWTEQAHSLSAGWQRTSAAEPNWCVQEGLRESHL